MKKNQIRYIHGVTCSEFIKFFLDVFVFASFIEEFFIEERLKLTAGFIMNKF